MLLHVAASNPLETIKVIVICIFLTLLEFAGVAFLVAPRAVAASSAAEFAMWLPKFEDIARGLLRCQRQPQVRAYLEEFAMTKRQFAPSPRSS